MDAAGSQTPIAYQEIYKTGELQTRIEQAVGGLARCRVCPWDCEVNRLSGETHVCRTGRYARVSSCFPHLGEEDCLRGVMGSGTIFFGWCNLRCVFCQNHDISQQLTGEVCMPEQLAGMMLRLQRMRCHNINWVTPEHVVPQILEAMPFAIEGGLKIPIVYNTSAFDSLESMHQMEGIVDIYMPDFKYWTEASSKRYLKTEAYPQYARAAIREMHRQVGDLVIGEDGLAVRGLLVRHLVMPGAIEETREIMRFLAEEISPDTYVNIIEQYNPMARVDVDHYSEINRRVTADEMKEAFRVARDAGLHRFDRRGGAPRVRLFE